MSRVLVKRILPGWAAVALAGMALAAPEAVSPTLRLVVRITVDQWRADMLAENLERFSPGGFRDLARDGVYYRRATCDHAITFTATVGREMHPDALAQAIAELCQRLAAGGDSAGVHPGVDPGQIRAHGEASAAPLP